MIGLHLEVCIGAWAVKFENHGLAFIVDEAASGPFASDVGLMFWVINIMLSYVEMHTMMTRSVVAFTDECENSKKNMSKT